VGGEFGGAQAVHAGTPPEPPAARRVLPVGR
jgi:hypothetical protein